MLPDSPLEVPYFGLELEDILFVFGKRFLLVESVLLDHFQFELPQFAFVLRQSFVEFLVLSVLLLAEPFGLFVESCDSVFDMVDLLLLLSDFPFDHSGSEESEALPQFPVGLPEFAELQDSLVHSLLELVESGKLLETPGLLIGRFGLFALLFESPDPSGESFPDLLESADSSQVPFDSSECFSSFEFELFAFD